MSQWTHPICEDCYDDRFPGREPSAMGNPEPERCCDCGKATTDGIYFREDPDRMRAHETHPDD